PTASIERHLAGDVPVVRAMPNAPSTVHEGIAGMCAGSHAGREHLDRAGTVLRAVGDVAAVPEEAMDAITAVSGSGPAYHALLDDGARRGDTIVLSGGSVGPAYAAAAALEPDWSDASVWWGDERCVPPEDERSNYGLAKRTLLDRLEREPEVHRIRGELRPAD